MTGAETITASVRPLGEDDYTLVADWLMDPEINRFLYKEWRNRKISDKLVALASNGPKNRMWLGLVDGEPYSLIAIGGVDPEDGSGVLWYLRGSGVKRIPAAMTHCVALALREAFRTLNLHSINGTIHAYNIASIKILETLGFKRVGAMREAFLVDGRYVDGVVFDVLEDELTHPALADG